MSAKFRELYRLTRTSQGKYTIRYSEIAPYYATDYADKAGDNLTILGDVSDDHFTLSGSHITTSVIYKGTTGNSVVLEAFGQYYLLTQKSYTKGAAISATSAAFTLCFASGTRIRTTRGDVPVERLAVGDFVVTASGGTKPIRWLGNREVDCAAYADPRRAWPVRIAAHAFGEGKPARDLVVSPDHAICVDCLGEMLVPAFAFLNGATVTQDRVERVTYWHVELEHGHDILLAENLPAESYLDIGNGAFFLGEGVAEDVAMDPPLDAEGSCRERTNDPALLTALRAQMRKHALGRGWQLEDVAFGGLRLIADGATILPDTAGLAARFVLPADARDVWLVSAASVPWHVSDAADGRRLGLCLAALSVTDGLGPLRAVALDDARLADGFHDLEDGFRWTDGRARLPPELWAGCRGQVFLRLDLARPCISAWRAPAGHQGWIVHGVAAVG